MYNPESFVTTESVVPRSTLVTVTVTPGRHRARSCL